MPEGDTVHHAAMRLAAVLEGRVPDRLTMPQPRHGRDRWAERLAGRAVRSVDAHGKHLFLRFDGELTLHSHLRMSGSWGVYRDGEGWRRPRRRAWLVIESDGWQAVEFDGPVLELLSEARLRSDPRIARLGPDVIGASFDERAFLKRLREDDPTRPIADALLDQSTIAGIGNMWKAEILFAAELDPWRATGTVSDGQALAAVAFAREHMTRAARDGFWARPRAVYRRAGMPCPRCGAKIRQRGQGENNRVTFWCPGCQR